MTLEAVRRVASAEDVIVLGWHSQEEFELLTHTVAKRVFWQHGTLIPTGRGLVGARMLDPRLSDQYWNVSRACAKFISEKYNTHEPHIVPPFFSSVRLKSVGKDAREGVLFQQRRGFELYPVLKKVAESHGVPTTLLKAPFHNDELVEALSTHKFFVSYDRGLRYHQTLGRRRAHFIETRRSGGSLSEALNLPAPWIKHKPKMLGFPVSAAQAASQGVIVIGFAMGGGLDWMGDQTAYVARDGSRFDLRKQLKRALTDSDSILVEKREAAFRAIEKFDSENTWAEISSALGIR